MAILGLSLGVGHYKLVSLGVSSCLKKSLVRGRRSGSKDGLTTADLVVLSLLAERSMHGYDLLSEYQRQEVADWASISKAQLYYALKKLNGLGLLSELPESGGSRDRVIYSVTATGRKALATGLTDKSWASGRIAQPFLTWFGLSIHASDKAQREVLHQRMLFLDKEIAKEKGSLAYIETLTDARAMKGADIVRLTVQQLETERAWLRALIDRREP